MSNLINSSYDDVELSRSDIDYGKLSVNENPLAHLTEEIFEFLKVNKVDDYVKIRRKHILYIEPVICNKLMMYLFDKYKDNTCITKVDIFDVVTKFVDVEPADFYNSLTDKIQNLLKKSLTENLGFDIDLDVDKTELKQLGYKQVKI